MSETQNEKKPKMTRRAIREAVFKLLFMAEFNSEEEMIEQQELFFTGIGAQQPEDTVPEEEDRETISGKYDRVREKLPEIDDLLNRTAEGWKTSRMSKVDLSILRLAVYEVLFDASIPVGVAINEAVEIAKRYGGEDSRSFVNGILGKIANSKRD